MGDTDPFSSSICQGATMSRFAVLASFFALLWAPVLAVGADKPQVVELWPGKPPDEPGTIGAEYVRMSQPKGRKYNEVTEPTRLVTNVTKPTITIYRPAKDKDNG